MFGLPTEWQNNNNGNTSAYKERSKMSQQANDLDTGRIHRHKCDPVISIPELKELKKRTVSKDFSHNVVNDIKTRSSQLSDTHFKDMPKMVRIKTTDISTYHVPSFTTSTNDLIERPREFKPVIKKNEMSLERTATKEMPYKKINPEDVAEKASEKHKFNRVSFEARERMRPAPIVPVAQERKRLIVKY